MGRMALMAYERYETEWRGLVVIASVGELDPEAGIREVEIEEVRTPTGYDMADHLRDDLMDSLTMRVAIEFDNLERQRDDREDREHDLKVEG